MHVVVFCTVPTVEFDLRGLVSFVEEAVPSGIRNLDVVLLGVIDGNIRWYDSGNNATFPKSRPYYLSSR